LRTIDPAQIGGAKVHIRGFDGLISTPKKTRYKSGAAHSIRLRARRRTQCTASRLALWDQAVKVAISILKATMNCGGAPHRCFNLVGDVPQNYESSPVW